MPSKKRRRPAAPTRVRPAAGPEPGPDPTRRLAASPKARTMVGLLCAATPVATAVAIWLAIAAIPAHHEAQRFDQAPTCAADGPPSPSDCRVQTTSTVTGVAFHPKRGRVGSYTIVTLDAGETEILDGERSDVSAGDVVLLTLWKGRITDFTLHGVEHHDTDDWPGRIAGKRPIGAAVALCAAVLMYRGILWDRLARRVRLARFALAEALLVPLLIVACALAGLRDVTAELVVVLVTIPAAAASPAWARLPWVARPPGPGPRRL